MISYILAILCGFLILGADQLSKYYIATNFELGESAEFINGLIDIIYINNKGGAWGILQGYTWALLAVTAILMVVCFTLLVKLGRRNKIVFWAVSLVLFGGLGNMIDRIFRGGNVVDFLHFEFYPQFPIFNVADCAVVIGAFILLGYFIYDSIKDSKEKKKKMLEQLNKENE
ncbi:MAG: signal peptidase II [Clostridia bacterium]|nr:signal peptidase II [Clostridia bacterium]